MPAAPVLFSTITGWPSATRSFSAMMRAGTSLGPPAGKPTSMRMVRFGKSCADAADRKQRKHDRQQAPHRFPRFHVAQWRAL